MQWYSLCKIPGCVFEARENGHQINIRKRSAFPKVVSVEMAPATGKPGVIFASGKSWRECAATLP